MLSVPARLRVAIVAILLCGTLACASAPPAPPPKPIGPTFEQKMAWILRLEDQRSLRDPAPTVAPPVPVPARGAAPVVVPPPPPPDLLRLLTDEEARVRRRAALAVGRVGLRDAVQPLVALLRDADPEVRQMAAFALGLIADASAREPLTAALADESPLVRGSAAEALGLIGDRAAADAIGRMMSQVVESGALNDPPSEQDAARRETPAGAFRLGAAALVRLGAYEPLAAAILDPAGQPRVRWWPAAFALQRLEDRRALGALVTLAREGDAYTKVFALKGLGALKDRSATPVVLPLMTGADRFVAIEAVRAAGRIGDPAAADALLRIAEEPKADAYVRLEAVTALGSIRAPGVIDLLLDFLTDRDPSIRSAALQSVAALDPEGFIVVLSALPPDASWNVRATLASVLATFRPEVGLPRLRSMLADPDQRVVAAALATLTKLAPSEAVSSVLERLKADDPVVRAAAAKALGGLKPREGAAELAAAYQLGQRDATYVARAAALDALAAGYDAAAATPVLQAALADKDWAVRVKAAALLKRLAPSNEVDTQMRPAPTQLQPATYQAPRLVVPPVSTQAFIDTERGTIEIELAVLDAPLTVENFVTLARRGFFNGLTFHRVVPGFVVQGGDPRGDGEGGPGYTIRDELNERPYVRGAVGMALDWADTGGSQFFITHSPQPHLDAKYTAFGRVTAGMDVVDQIQQGDVIRQIRIWDGQETPPVPTGRQ